MPFAPGGCDQWLVSTYEYSEKEYVTSSHIGSLALDVAGIEFDIGGDWAGRDILGRHVDGGRCIFRESNIEA